MSNREKIINLVHNFVVTYEIKDVVKGFSALKEAEKFANELNRNHLHLECIDGVWRDVGTVRGVWALVWEIAEYRDTVKKFGCFIHDIDNIEPCS